MADNANDKPQRTAADKERSRQMSRSVSGKDAARTVSGGGNRRQAQQATGGRGTGKSGQGAQGGRQPQGGRDGQGGRDNRGRPQAKGARQAAGAGRGGRSSRPGQRSGPSRRPAPRQRQSRTGLYIWGSVGLVIVIVVALVLVNVLSKTTTSPLIYKAKPVSAKVQSEITHVPASVYNAVGTGIPGTIAPPKTPKTAQPLLKYTGKPGVFALLGQFCPYCAAERWAVITSFSRFGTFTGLRTMQSSPVDVDPKTQTFTFEAAKYSSPYFSAKLIEYFGQDYNRTGAHKVIGTLTTAEKKLVVKYDHSTTTSSTTSGLSIPFMDIGNKLVVEGVSYNPSPLQNLSRATIAGGLSNPSNAVTKLIIGTSNYLSASICSIDGGKPGSVCQSSGVQAAAKALNLHI